MQASSDHVIQPSGQETTANALLFAIILIHQHPEVLDRYMYVHVYMCTWRVSVHFCMISLGLIYQSIHRTNLLCHFDSMMKPYMLLAFSCVYVSVDIHVHTHVSSTVHK